jgi:hypothetical protein
LNSAEPLKLSKDAVRLAIRGPDGRCADSVLEPETSVFAGAGSNCGIRLTGAEVSPAHCLFRHVAGRICVMDWCSLSGTFVNGERIQSEAEVVAGDEIRVGEYTICPQVSVPEGTESGPKTSAERGAQLGDDQSSPKATQLDDAPSRTTSSPPEPPRGQGLAQPATPRSQAAAGPETVEANVPGPAAPQTQDVIALLQAEVEQLQLELADRDARLAEMTTWSNECGAPGIRDDAQSPEMEALAERLEELLDELEKSDERVVVLEEQRRLTEEACEAEREERRQLDAWINEIERRVAQRDREREAENQSLRHRVDELVAERSRLEQQLKVAGHQGQPGQGEAQLMQALRDENARLRQRVDQTDAARLQLEKKLRDAQQRSDSETLSATVDKALREERIRMAQQRAELARQQAKLLQLKTELDQRLARDRESLSEGDTRLRAFRDHLREIHQNEQQARREGGLVNRLTRLWNRLEG